MRRCDVAVACVACLFAVAAQWHVWEMTTRAFAAGGSNACLPNSSACDGDDDNNCEGCVACSSRSKTTWWNPLTRPTDEGGGTQQTYTNQHRCRTIWTCQFVGEIFQNWDCIAGTACVNGYPDKSCQLCGLGSGTSTWYDCCYIDWEAED